MSDGVAIQALREQPRAEETDLFLDQQRARICGVQLFACGTSPVLQVSDEEWAGQIRAVEEAPYKCCLLRPFYPDDNLGWGNIFPLVQVVKRLQDGVYEDWINYVTCRRLWPWAGNWVRTRFQLLVNVRVDPGNLGQVWCSGQIGGVHMKDVSRAGQRFFLAGNVSLVTWSKGGHCGSTGGSFRPRK